MAAKTRRSTWDGPTTGQEPTSPFHIVGVFPFEEPAKTLLNGGRPKKIMENRYWTLLNATRFSISHGSPRYLLQYLHSQKGHTGPKKKDPSEALQLTVGGGLEGGHDPLSPATGILHVNQGTKSMPRKPPEPLQSAKQLQESLKVEELDGGELALPVLARVDVNQPQLAQRGGEMARVLGQPLRDEEVNELQLHQLGEVGEAGDHRWGQPGVLHLDREPGEGEEPEAPQLPEGRVGVRTPLKAVPDGQAGQVAEVLEEGELAKVLALDVGDDQGGEAGEGFQLADAALKAEGGELEGVRGVDAELGEVGHGLELGKVHGLTIGHGDLLAPQGLEPGQPLGDEVDHLNGDLVEVEVGHLTELGDLEGPEIPLPGVFLVALEGEPAEGLPGLEKPEELVPVAHLIN